MAVVRRLLLVSGIGVLTLACGSDSKDEPAPMQDAAVEPETQTDAAEPDVSSEPESSADGGDTGETQGTDMQPSDAGPHELDSGALSPSEAGALAVTDSGVEPEPTEAGMIEPDAMGPDVAAWPEDGVTLIQLDENGHAQLTSTFEGAAALPDQDWARDPDVACWDQSTSDEFFSASHVAFALVDVVPEWSEVTINLTPEGSAEANIYVIEMPVSQADIPPAIDSAKFCSVPVQLGSPGAPSELKLRTYNGDSHIMFGVSNRGRFNGDDTANFDIEVQVTPLAAQDRCYDNIDKPYKYPTNVNLIELDAAGSATLTGTLGQGAPVCDNAFINDQFCAPATRFDMFGGNHVFYAIEGGIPDTTVLNITVTPDPGVDVSIYSTLQGTTSYYVPPNLPTGICDASYHATWEGAPVDANPGEAESLTLIATTNPYNVFFAVAGTTVQGASGGFTVSIDTVDTSTDNCQDADIQAVLGLEDWPSNVNTITVDTTSGEGFATLTGDLADGAQQCTLDWASNSSVACFPLTQRDYFDGAHMFYALAEPPPPGSQVTFRVIPEAGVEVSAYAYRIGTQNYLVPPYVPSVVQCEASHGRALDHSPNPGVVEEVSFYGGTNAYNYFLGVAGYAGGVVSGAYEVQVEITEPPPPFCPESLPGATYSTWPTSVELITLSDGQGSASGNLDQGSCMNLNFADDSSVACFPQPHFEYFEGNHVEYALTDRMPPHSELTVTVTPEAGQDVNLYGFQSGTTNFPVPPNIPSVPVCEASYDPTGTNPGEAESIYFANPTDNEYNISFVVAGDAATGTSGAYDIDVQLSVGETHCAESLPGQSGLTAWPSDVSLMALDSDGLGSVQGDLSTGMCMNLDWASNSSVACFPATRFDRFEGNHVMYALQDPMPPNSIATITLTPDTGVDVNLYGYQIGETNYLVPPAVPSVVACEASYPNLPSNPGEVERITFYNPSDTASYNIFYAVAGGRDVVSGGYTLDVQLQVGTTHCEESLPGQPQNAWPSTVEQLSPSIGTPLALTADLATGECVNLAFASDSSVACFPATQDVSFEGNHVFYALQVPGQTQLSVALTSANDVANVYGYLIGADSYYVPPYVPGTISCEASLPPFTALEDDVITFQNIDSIDRQVFFAVAGESGVISGEVGVSVELSSLP